MDHTRRMQLMSNPIYHRVNQCIHKILKEQGTAGLQMINLIPALSTYNVLDSLEPPVQKIYNDKCKLLGYYGMLQADLPIVTKAQVLIDYYYDSEYTHYNKQSMSVKTPIKNNLTTSIDSNIHYIYLIYHINTIQYPTKKYVGRTIDVIRRMNEEHFNPKYWDRSPNKLLYWNMRLDGVDQYAYKILEICHSEQQAKERENYWIEKLHTLSKYGGFNERKEIAA